MASKGLGNSPAKLLEEFKQIRCLDVVLPVQDHNPLRLRVVAKPDDYVQILLQRLDIKIPNRPKVVANVVENLAVKFCNYLKINKAVFELAKLG